MRGVIRDGSGQRVARAIVTLRSAHPAQTFSGADGGYSFPRLEINSDYEVVANRNGLASPVRTLRLASASETAIIDLVIGPRIVFEEIGEKAGLRFVLKNGATGKAYQPEIMLGGLGAFDFNNDGCMDLFATNGGGLPSGKKHPNGLFRNNCDGTFTDVTARSGLGGTGYSMGVGAGDYDNDGFVDLVVTGLDGARLYRNRGDGTFKDVTLESGLVAKHWSISAGWFDYDNDGKLDLFITNYVAWKPELDKCTLGGAPYYCNPRVYRGLPNQLFHNNGDGTFTDVSALSGIGSSIGKGMGVAFGDFNNDGLTDIFVANDSMPNFLFQNLGHGRFREVAGAMGVQYGQNGNAVAGMGVDFRDFDNDGRDDIALDAMYFDTFPLYRNVGTARAGTFTDVTVSSGVGLATRNLTGWGMGLFDFDNDSLKDLFYASGHFPGSRPYVHEDAETRNLVLRNTGAGTFEDVSPHAGAGFQERALFHGAAFADFDNDGRVDVAVSAVNGRLRLYRNVSPDAGHWIAVRLEGTRSNRQGLGARIRVTLPTGMRIYNHATTSVGYASASEPLVRFGLGPYEYAPEIEIRWPSGKIQSLKNVNADQLLTVREP